MYYLLYLSSASQAFSPAELEALLAKSRTHNAAIGVTGLLIHIEGNFLQYLEGEKETVERLYQKIEQDPRHVGLIRMLDGPSEKRYFKDWAMGYQKLTQNEWKSIYDALFSNDESNPQDQSDKMAVIQFIRGFVNRNKAYLPFWN